MRYASSQKLLLAWDAERTRGGAGGDDERGRPQYLGRAPHDPPIARDLDALDGVEDELGAGSLGLFVQERSELMAGNSAREAGEVLDSFCIDDLAPHTKLREHCDFEPISARKHRSRQPGHAGSDDH